MTMIYVIVGAILGGIVGLGSCEILGAVAGGLLGGCRTYGNQSNDPQLFHLTSLNV